MFALPVLAKEVPEVEDNDTRLDSKFPIIAV
jgi:hypothetical protein